MKKADTPGQCRLNSALLQMVNLLFYRQNGSRGGEAPAEPRLGITLSDPKTVRLEPHPPASLRRCLGSRRFGIRPPLRATRTSDRRTSVE